MVREVVSPIGGQAHGSQAEGVLEQQRGGVPGRGRTIAMKAVSPVLLFQTCGRGPIPMGEGAQVVGIHLAIVLPR